MAVDANPPRVPTAEDEVRFWALIESAWAPLGPGVNQVRRALATEGPDREAPAEMIGGALDSFVENITNASRGLTGDEVTDLDWVVERKLYETETAEVQAATDGSDEGFLFARGFIVGMGQTFCEAVVRDPATVIMDAECEAMCHLFAHVYAKDFGDFPATGSGISRASGSNRAGWPA
jgi:hypothetical protein